MPFLRGHQSSHSCVESVEIFCGKGKPFAQRMSGWWGGRFSSLLHVFAHALGSHRACRLTRVTRLRRRWTNGCEPLGILASANAFRSLAVLSTHAFVHDEGMCSILDSTLWRNRQSGDEGLQPLHHELPTTRSNSLAPIQGHKTRPTFRWPRHCHCSRRHRCCRPGCLLNLALFLSSAKARDGDVNFPCPAPRT